MSKREPYGNINMKGKLYEMLTCGCCEVCNGKKLYNPDYMKEYWEEVRQLSWEELNVLMQEDGDNDL